MTSLIPRSFFCLLLVSALCAEALGQVAQFESSSAEDGSPVKGVVYEVDQYNQPNTGRIISSVDETGRSPKLEPPTTCGMFNAAVSIPAERTLYLESDAARCRGKTIVTLSHPTVLSQKQILEKTIQAEIDGHTKKALIGYTELFGNIAKRDSDLAKRAQVHAYRAISKIVGIDAKELLHESTIKEIQMNFNVEVTGYLDTKTIREIAESKLFQDLFEQKSTYLNQNSRLQTFVSKEDLELPHSKPLIFPAMFNARIGDGTVLEDTGHTEKDYASGSDTLKQVRSKGFVQCGVSTGLTGFSRADQSGNWSGLDVDVCRAVAAAALGNANYVKFTPLTAKERFTALQSGEVDLLSRNTTWTLTRDASLGIKPAGISFYDGQGFMVRRSLGVKSALELNDASVCFRTGAVAELNLADYYREHGMKYKAVVSDDPVMGFEKGLCDVLTLDQSQLLSIRTNLKNPDTTLILPELISKEPLSPIVRQGDERWFNVVKWSLNAMVNAEELGINSRNIDRYKNSKSPRISRLMSGQGEMLGLNDDWAYNIVKQVGNYGEAFERNFSTGLQMDIPRGLNSLWNKGGLQYSPPFR